MPHLCAVSLDTRGPVANDGIMVKVCSWLRGSVMKSPLVPTVPHHRASGPSARSLRTLGALGLCAGLGAGLLGGCVEVPVNSLSGSKDMARPNTNSDMRTDMAQNLGPAWRWESPQPQGNNLRALWGIAGATADADQIYAGGDNGALLIGGATGWQLQRLGAQDQRAILSLSGQSSGGTLQVLAVGFFDLALRRAGTQWTELPVTLGTGDGALTSIWATATGGEYFVVGTTGRIYHVLSGGNSWTREGAGVKSFRGTRECDVGSAFHDTHLTCGVRLFNLERVSGSATS